MIFKQLFSTHFKKNIKNIKIGKAVNYTLLWPIMPYTCFLAHQNRRFGMRRKGDAPASVVMRQQSSNIDLLLWNCWADLPQIWSVESLWQSHLICSCHFNWPLLGVNRAKNRKKKPLIIFYRTNWWMITKLCL
jgi:hypothetical protein